uniref:Uncharacterized protein n=1 Tax=Oryza punctata TaxID=4537 RepID=A0A0E0M0G1_ORYPU
MARRSNPALVITLCCLFTALMPLAFVCFLPYVCPLDGDDAGLTHVWAPVLVRTDADTLMQHKASNNCCRVHPSTGVVGAVPTLFVSTGAESHHQGKKKSGRMAPLLIMLLLAIAATGSAAADARGSGCSNDVNLPGRMHACGPPSVKPHN